jgi:hypothetical protein
LAAENRGPEVISQKSYHTNKTLKLLAQRKLVNWNGGRCEFLNADALRKIAQCDEHGRDKRPLI